MSAFALTPTAALFSQPSTYQDRTLTVGGWLLSARFSKRVGFLVLSDGSSQSTVQVVVREALLADQPDLRKLGAGTSVRVTGVWTVSPGQGQSHELVADQVEVVGQVEDPMSYPIQPKEHTAEFLREVPHLRSRTAQFGAVARLRDRVAACVHQFFRDRGFAWVATPILTHTDAEGAGERFAVQAHDGAPFFAQPAFLTVSGQLEGEALCSALSRVYCFGPTFRAERSHTRRHLAEFWMVEPELAFATLSDLVALADGLVRTVVADCLAHLPQEMAYFAAQGGWTLAQWARFADTPVQVVSYTDAVALLADRPDAPAWGDDLGSEQEKALVEKLGGMVAVVDYPAAIKSFYMKASDDGRTVAAMDLLVPGMGELVGGSLREERLDRLVAVMQARGMDPALYQHYLDLRRYGSVPHGGFGLGFERLIAFMAGLPSVKDAIPYPRVAQ